MPWDVKDVHEVAPSGNRVGRGGVAGEGTENSAGPFPNAGKDAASRGGVSPDAGLTSDERSDPSSGGFASPTDKAELGVGLEDPVFGSLKNGGCPGPFEVLLAKFESDSAPARGTGEGTVGQRPSFKF